MVKRWLVEIESKFPRVRIDSFQLMPNHLHAIVVMMGGGLDMAAKFGIGIQELDLESADDNFGTPQSTGQMSSVGRFPRGNSATFGVDDPTLGRVVQWFKTMTTNEYVRGVRQLGCPPFFKRLWQRDYFDHVIRNEVTFERIRTYIRNNPLYWSVERDHPDRIGASTFDQWLSQNEL
jgi:REP element-mobilizing transposase RayT